MNFRLRSIAIETNEMHTNAIKLIDKEPEVDTNYITLLVGNNGTGKSRILSSIARYFIEQHEGKTISLFNNENFEHHNSPSKVIALTNSISDKFPIDKSFRHHYKQRENHESNKLLSNFYYNYLGTRNRLNSFSNKALINRALEIVFENYSEFKTSRNYRHVFDYLDYRPVIKFNYRFSSIRNQLRNITPQKIIELTEQNNQRNLSYLNPNTADEIRSRANELCTFILNHSLSEKTHDLLINFSEKNIDRISRDSTLYEDGLRAYNLIELLRKIRIVRTIEIQVFKNEGKPFNFREASSGEASVLSTLIALVPLLKDGALLLIDEPEISLHPLWQSRYIELLQKILSNVSGCHIIIASHSPFIASDLKPNESAVVALKSQSGNINGHLLEKSTYGWSAEDILLNVFDMPSTRNIDLYNTVSKALQLLADDDRSKKSLLTVQKRLKAFYPSILDSDPMKSVIKAIFEAK